MVSATSIDPAVAVLFLECTVHWFYLAEHVILVNVFHPIVPAILLVIIFLVFAALGVINLALKAVVLFHLFQVGNGLRE
jgi:hypothetical protein